MADKGFRPNTVSFDMRGVRTIIYRDAPSGYEDLTKQLTEYLVEMQLIAQTN